MHLAMEGAIIDGSASVGVGLLLGAVGLVAGYVSKMFQSRLVANGKLVRESVDIQKMRTEVDALNAWRTEVKKAEVEDLQAEVTELKEKLADLADSSAGAGSGVRKVTQPHPRGAR